MRVAVFVDAGYVYAQGSSAITGLKTPKARELLVLDEVKLVGTLKARALEVSHNKELLRIYWYDAAPQTGPSGEQIRIGQLDDVKLRLGQLNSERQQKGVDSLIVTDLMELARNKAIADAVVVTGDEDIRVGVQIAQSLGVRVHLLGISGPKTSQSITLQHEADTVLVWDKSVVSTFLTLQVALKPAATKPVAVAKAKRPPVKAAPAKQAPDKPVLEQIAAALHRTFDALRLDEVRFKRAQKTLGEGKELPEPAVTMLKTEISKIGGRPLTKAGHKIARDELSKRLRDAR